MDFTLPISFVAYSFSGAAARVVLVGRVEIQLAIWVCSGALSESQAFWASPLMS